MIILLNQASARRDGHHPSPPGTGGHCSGSVAVGRKHTPAHGMLAVPLTPLGPARAPAEGLHKVCTRFAKGGKLRRSAEPGLAVPPAGQHGCRSQAGAAPAAPAPTSPELSR